MTSIEASIGMITRQEARRRNRTSAKRMTLEESMVWRTMRLGRILVKGGFRPAPDRWAHATWIESSVDLVIRLGILDALQGNSELELKNVSEN